MAEGHGRDAWARLSALLALTANCHRDPKRRRALRPSDFDPFGRELGEVVQVDRENIGLLKEALTKGKGVRP